jgi:hypothetical protein
VPELLIDIKGVPELLIDIKEDVREGVVMASRPGDHHPAFGRSFVGMDVDPLDPSSSMLAGEALERSSSPTDLVRRQVGPWPDERDRALDGEPLDIMEPPRSTSEILLRAWPGRVAFVRDQRRSPILKRHGDRHLDPSGVAERAEPLVDRLPPAGQASSGRLRVSPSRNAVSARRMLASRSSRSSSSGWSTPRSWVQ